MVSGNVWRDTCSVQRLYWNSVRTALTSPNGARTRSEECDPPNGTLRTAPSSSHPAGENAETQRGQGDPGQASPVPRCTRANVETGASPNSAPDTPGLHPTPTIIQGRESRWPSSINSGVGGWAGCAGDGGRNAEDKVLFCVICSSLQGGRKPISPKLRKRAVLWPLGLET